MARWKIVLRRKSSNQKLSNGSVEIVTDYSNKVLQNDGDWKRHRAIRIHNLVSIAGKTPVDLGLTPSAPPGAATITELGEYNGSGHHFIRLRDDVGLNDFEIVVVE